MLSISAVKAPKDAKNYYENDNYYAKGEDNVVPGMWWGEGASQLGLTGVVNSVQFIELLSGHMPNGQQLGIIKGQERLYRPGYDFTFSAPKSVSLLAQIGGDQRLIAAHDHAVNVALTHIQRLATARRSHSGTITFEATRNLVVAKYQHDTSRALDPQLHTHAVVLNATIRNDGKVVALASQSKHSVVKDGLLGFMEQVYSRKLHFGTVYRSALAQEVVKHGYHIDVTHADGRFEITDIPTTVIKAFSKRRKDIEAALNERGLEGGKASEKATLMTRAHKTKVDRAVLHADWQDRAKEVGLECQTLIEKSITQKENVNIPTQEEALTLAAEAVNYARKHLSERQAAFTVDELAQVSMTHALGQLGPHSIDEAIRTAMDKGELIGGRYQQKKLLTTPEAVALEERNIALMQSMRSKVASISEFYLASPLLWAAGLNKSQFEAASLIATTQDGVVGIQGYAGTGKTTLLRAVHELADVLGYKVKGMAPSAAAAAALMQETGILSQTLDSFLFDMQKNEAAKRPNTNFSDTTSEVTPPKKLWILDESSLASSRIFNEFLMHAQREQAHVVLLGDIQQLGAVEAGKPFEQLQRAGMSLATMQEIIRQKNPDLLSAVYAAIDGNITKAVAKVSSGVIEIADKDERLSTLASHYLSLSEAERARTLVITPANDDRLVVNQYIHEGLKTQGLIDSKDIQASILRNKSLTLVEQTRAKSYDVGDWVCFARSIDVFEKRTYYQVSSRDIATNTLWLRHGKQDVAFQPERHGAGERGVLTVYQADKRQLAAGDVIRWTLNQRHLGRLNAMTGVVQSINQKTAKILGHDGKLHQLKLDEKQHQHFDYAYALTVYAAQGKTVYRVLAHDESFREKLTNQRAFYVILSRAQMEVQLYVDDKTRYIEQLILATGEKVAALDVDTKQLQIASSDKGQHSPTLGAQFNQSDAALLPSHPSVGRAELLTSISTKTPHYDIVRLYDSLVNIAPYVVEKLLGEPNRQLSNATTWRYGKKGSLAVTIQGDKRGLWYNFERGSSGNLFQLIEQTACLSFKETLTMAADLTGMSLSTLETSTTLSTNIQRQASIASLTPSQEDVKAMAYANQLIKKSVSIEGTLAQRYLEEYRGIRLKKWPESLRFIPAIKHSQSGQEFPALLSIATNDKGEIQAAQLTYLDPNTYNKADVIPNKVQHGRMRFGAQVVLQEGMTQGRRPFKEVLIAEGVETALSLAMARSDARVIATLSVSNMRNLKLGDSVQTLMVCADNDKGKGHAFTLLGKAITHLSTQADTLRFAIPDTIKTDFNDVLKRGGVSAVQTLVNDAKALFPEGHLLHKTSSNKDNLQLQQHQEKAATAAAISTKILTEMPIKTPVINPPTLPVMQSPQKSIDQELEL